MLNGARKAATVVVGVVAAGSMVAVTAPAASAQSDHGKDRRHDVVRHVGHHAKRVRARRNGDITSMHARYLAGRLHVTVRFRALKPTKHTRVTIPLRITYSKRMAFPSWGPPDYQIRYNPQTHRAHVRRTSAAGSRLLNRSDRWTRACGAHQSHNRHRVSIRLSRRCTIGKRIAVGARFHQVRRTHHGHRRVRYHDTWVNHGHHVTRRMKNSWRFHTM